MAIIRTYHLDEKNQLHFREAWYQQFENEDLGQFVINHGAVGHQSKTSSVQDVDMERADELFAGFLEQCQADGYARSRSRSSLGDRAVRTEERVRHRTRPLPGTQGHRRADLPPGLAWLGTVESSDFAPHKLNIRILTPAPKKAVAAVKVCIREAKLDFTKMTIATAGYDGLQAAKTVHPLPPKPFSLT